MDGFDGQVALVTGAAQGLGRSIATLLARRGATVYLADLNGPRVEIVSDDLRRQQLSAIASCTDMADAPAVHALRDRIAAEAGRLDVLINNAGDWRYETIREVMPANWDWTFRSTCCACSSPRAPAWT